MVSGNIYSFPKRNDKIVRFYVWKDYELLERFGHVWLIRCKPFLRIRLCELNPHKDAGQGGFYCFSEQLYPALKQLQKLKNRKILQRKVMTYLYKRRREINEGLGKGHAAIVRI